MADSAGNPTSQRRSDDPSPSSSTSSLPSTGSTSSTSHTTPPSPGKSILLNPLPPNSHPSPPSTLQRCSSAIKKAFVPPGTASRPTARQAVEAAEKARRKREKSEGRRPSPGGRTASYSGSSDGNGYAGGEALGKTETGSSVASTSGTSTSSKEPSIKFAPLPTSGRVKRANSITLGVASRAQMLAGMPLRSPPARPPSNLNNPNRTMPQSSPGPKMSMSMNSGGMVPQSPSAPVRTPLPSPALRAVQGDDRTRNHYRSSSSASATSESSTSSSGSGTESSGEASSSSTDEEDDVYTYKDLGRALNKVVGRNRANSKSSTTSDASSNGSGGGKKRKGKKERKRDKERAKSNGKAKKGKDEGETGEKGKDKGEEKRVERSGLPGSTDSSSSSDEGESGWHDEDDESDSSGNAIVVNIPAEDLDFDADDNDSDEDEDDDEEEGQSFVDAADLQIDTITPSPSDKRNSTNQDFSSAMSPSPGLLARPRKRQTPQQQSKGGLLGGILGLTLGGGGDADGDGAGGEETPRAAKGRTPNGSRPSTPPLPTGRLPSPTRRSPPPAGLISEASVAGPETSPIMATSKLNGSAADEAAEGGKADDGFRFHASEEFQRRYGEMRRRYSGGKITSLAQREEGRREWRRDHPHDGPEGSADEEDVGEVAKGERWSASGNDDTSGTHTPTARTSNGVSPLKGGHRSSLEREVSRRRSQHDRAVWGYERGEEEGRAWKDEEWRKGIEGGPTSAAVA